MSPGRYDWYISTLSISVARTSCCLQTDEHGMSNFQVIHCVQGKWWIKASDPKHTLAMMPKKTYSGMASITAAQIYEGLIPYHASEFFLDSLWVNTHNICRSHPSHHLRHLQQCQLSATLPSFILQSHLTEFTKEMVHEYRCFFERKHTFETGHC